MREPIGSVSRVQSSEGEGGLLVAPGALNVDDKDQVTFFGDGVTSPRDVMARVIELEPELKEFHRNQDAAHYTALMNMNAHNPALRGRAPDAPLPKMEQFHAQAGRELKTLLAPLANRLDELRSMVASMGTTPIGADKRQSVVTGNVRSLGLVLPLDD